MKKAKYTLDPCSKCESWSYSMTWYTYEHRKLIEDSVEKKLIALLTAKCKELKISLNKVQVEADQVQFQMDSAVQLNISKTIRSLQKVLSKSLCKAFPNLSGSDELWDSMYLVASRSHQVAKEDIRIKKLLNDLWAVEYYDLDESFMSYEDACCMNYLDEFKTYLEGRKLGIVDYGEQVFLIDQEALSKEINLNCFECTKIHKYGCCSGSPCDFSSENKKMFKKHSENIVEEVRKLDEQNYKKIVENGGFLTPTGTITECDGHCSLLVDHEGVSKCIAHKYALDQNIPAYDLCPLSCLMYPLEIMELITDKQKKVIFLTSVLDEDFAKGFGRWGSYKSMDVELRCIDKSAHNEIFREEEYKPVYTVNKKLLTHEFGASVYQGIEQLFD